MKNDRHDLAVIDIGSNSIRLFIFSVENGWAEQIHAEKYFTGLGKDLGVTGNLNPQSAEETLSCLKKFRTEIQSRGIESEIIIGTAALREANDSQSFLQTVKDATGFDIKIIDGYEEARLAALAVLGTRKNADGVVADFGGGSLELARIRNGQIEGKISLRLGAHYLKAHKEAAVHIDEAIQDLEKQEHAFNRPQALYIIGGAWRSLVKAWLMAEGKAGILVDGFSFAGGDILDFCDLMGTMQPEELVSRFHIEVPRSKLMDVSALMLKKLILILNPEEVIVSTAGIRDGVVQDYIFNLNKDIC